MLMSDDLTTYRRLVFNGTARIDLALKVGWTLVRSLNGYLTLTPPPNRMVTEQGTEYDVFPYKCSTSSVFGTIAEKYECIIVPTSVWKN